MTHQQPLVDYLVLGQPPHLEASECASCGARYFDRRNACAGCGAEDFHRVRIETSGVLESYTIVSFAAQGVEVPFVAGIVNCAGTRVRSNVVNVEADPDRVTLGMAVKMVTYSLGVDDEGTEAIGFGFEPALKAAGPHD